MSTADVNKPARREWAVHMRKYKELEVPSIKPVIKSLAPRLLGIRGPGGFKFNC